jgi:hypothetical protein
MRYRSATGLSAARTVGQIAAGLGAIAFFVSLAIVAVAAALRPAGRWRKLLSTLPAYFLAFALAGVALFLLRIGTTGLFTTVWLAAGGLLTIVSTIVAATRMSLGLPTARRALAALGATGMLSALSWLALAISIVIVLTSQPSTGGQTSQGGPAPAATAAPDQAPQGEPGPGGPEGQFGPEGRGGSTTSLLIGGVLVALFTAVELTSVARAPCLA